MKHSKVLSYLSVLALLSGCSTATKPVEKHQDCMSEKCSCGPKKCGCSEKCPCKKAKKKVQEQAQSTQVDVSTEQTELTIPTLERASRLDHDVVVEVTHDPNRSTNEHDNHQGHEEGNH